MQSDNSRNQLTPTSSPWSLLYDNRRLLVMAIGLIVVGGLSSFIVLPRMEDPLLTQRAAIINTLYPGASPERVEALITEKLEDELQEIEEIKELRSSSRSGISTITIELKDNVYAVDEVWSRVRDKIADAEPLLPDQARVPNFDKLEVTAYASIVALQWNLPGEPNYAILRRKAELLEDLLRAIPGTREVDTFGAPQEEILVEIKQHELGPLGLSVGEITRQLRASDAKVSAGLLRTDQGTFVIEVDTEFDSLERIRRLPIASGANGSFVPLGDIADISKGVTQPLSSLALVGSKSAIALGTLVSSQQRVDLWTADLESVLSEFAEQLPAGVELKVLFEQNEYVAVRLATLLKNLLLGAMAVVAVVWFMMGWRSAIAVGSALPLASLMVLSGMRLLGVPLHQMSITGLIIALGLLIDNAIVMVDEVRTRIAGGVSRQQAVARSTKHLAIPLFGSTVTTALSFAPIALMPGPAGEFVGSIAISVILAVASSLILALTVTPAIIAILDKEPSPQSASHWWTSGYSNASLSETYRSALDWIFQRPMVGVLVGVLLPVAGFLSATTLQEQFFPPADRNQFQVQLTMPTQSSLESTRQVAESARKVLLAHPEISEVSWFLGESAPPFYYNMLANRAGTPQYAQALVQSASAEGISELIQDLQEELNGAFPEARILVRQLEQGPPFDAPVEMRLYGPDLEVLREVGDQVRGVLADTPYVIHTTASLSETLPKLAVVIDQEQARLANLDHQDVAERLDFVLEGSVGGSLLESTEELPVRVRVGDSSRGSMEEIGSLDVGPESNAAEVPLSGLAKITLVPELSVIQHFNTTRMNEVQAYITAGTLPAQVLSDFQARLAKSGFEMPRGYRYEIGGEASKRDDAIGNLMSSVSVLVVLMIATLVLSFNSFRMAGLVGAVAVMSAGLSLGSLALFDYPFGFMGIVGTMGLIGVAINDTIVVLAALREDEAARSGDPPAVRQVVFHSTRHVLSTTLTTVAGFIPLILGGGGFWPPLATAISGGVIGATLLALVFIPSAFILVMCPKCIGKKSEIAAERQLSQVSHGNLVGAMS